jgi:flagellar protein FlaG
MGESTTITHAVLTIAAILMASLFVTVVIGQLNSTLNSISITMKTRSDLYRLSVAIVHASLDKQTNTIYVYAKNTGDVAYSDLGNVDFIVTDYNGRTFYLSTRLGNVTVKEYGSQPGVFEKGETVLFELALSGTYTSPLEVKLVLSNGYSTTCTVG